VKQQIVTILAILSSITVVVDSVAEGKPFSELPVNGKVNYSRNIRPIFVEHCYSCHGPEKQKSGFRLDRREDAFAGGDTGKAILAGNSSGSLLYRYVAGLDSETKMPPKGERLNPAQVQLIRDWIDQGAEWNGPTGKAQGTPVHWSFRAPVRAKPPEVQNKRWVRNAIDRFVLARLEAQRITPAPEADRATLIRRLSLDLIGLPPNVEQVTAFVRDPAPDAYERLVDSLLASPHFGERWGRHWLDLARYADSEGYQVDRARPHAYLYRDWVIDALNRDLPFDQFTIEQLAGDLIPNATVEQKIAAGFHRNTLMNHEDGVDREEFRCKAKVDRVATTGTAWLGLTVGCAECHTHKYDPITQKDFYSLYAFFNNAEEVDLPAQSFRQAAKYVPTFVHVRGDFLRKGEEVEPGAPAFLNAFKPHCNKADRMDLARWLVDPTNPLVSRVAVNRIWQHLFGKGLVATPEDFGARGDAPSHPELLDWLATEFMGNWSRKALIRQIVCSATYRQSANTRPELASIDPNNTLLARQNRFRLEAEVVRDLYLSCGGLLNPLVKGPSFRPQTSADFKALGAAGAFTWTDSEGPERYRRGMYIFAQRTVPYPVSMTFDEANPNESCPRRESSNTPLQALTLLNNPIFFEATEALAGRIAKFSGTDHDRITFAFELCLARKPSNEETKRLLRLLQDLRSLPVSVVLSVQPNRNPQSVIRDRDSSAYLLIAQVVMNLEEFITRE